MRKAKTNRKDHKSHGRIVKFHGYVDVVLLSVAFEPSENLLVRDMIFAARENEGCKTNC